MKINIISTGKMYSKHAAEVGPAAESKAKPWLSKAVPIPARDTDSGKSVWK